MQAFHESHWREHSIAQIALIKHRDDTTDRPDRQGGQGLSECSMPVGAD